MEISKASSNSVPISIVSKGVSNQKGEPATDVREQASSQPIDSTKVDKIVKSMNEFLAASPTPTHLKFEFHEELNEYYVTVVDEVSQEVVREIPAKRMLDMYASMKSLLGNMVDKKI